MKKILETIILNLVDNKDSVEIIETENEKEKEILLEVKVSKDDMGKVIGKQGRVAKAIRTIMKSMANKENLKKVTIEFIG